MQVDPLAEVITGIFSYHFGFNNPVSFSDPLGLMGDQRGADGLTTEEWIEQSRPHCNCPEYYEQFQFEKEFREWRNQNARGHQTLTVNGKTYTGRFEPYGTEVITPYGSSNNVEGFNFVDDQNGGNQNNPLEYLATANDMALMAAMGYNSIDQKHLRGPIYKTTQYLKNSSNIKIAPGKVYQSTKKFMKGTGKVLGKTANVIAVGSIAYDFGTGDANTATLVDAGMLIGGVIVTAAFGTAAAPFVVGAAAAYGVASIFGFDDYLNSTFDISDSINFIDK